MADKTSYPLTGKMYVKIPLVLESPFIIGSGESENTDVDVLLEPVSGKPIIPATSMVGVFRAFVKKCLPEDEQLKRNFIYLFGDEIDPTANPKKELEAQSALQCDDVILAQAKVATRDGVAIDHKTNTAKPENLFCYEIAEAYNRFDLNLDISLRQQFDTENFKKIIFILLSGIKHGHIRLGAKTNKGFGKLDVKIADVQATHLDFSNKNDVLSWITGAVRFGPMNIKGIPEDDFTRHQLKIDAWFRVKNSVLIRSYSDDPGDPDFVAISRNEGKDYVLPGTSMMGAIQHRAARILNTMRPQDAARELQDLFGFVDEQKELAKKGRVRIEETLFENVLAKIQTRIKIDRFTGGTFHGALFQAKPLWQNTDDEAMHFELSLQEPKDWEPGLFLYILKDLWTGDLPVGGDKSVGRGVFEGHTAKITWHDKVIYLSTDPTGNLVISDRDALVALAQGFSTSR